MMRPRVVGSGCGEREVGRVAKASVVLTALLLPLAAVASAHATYVSPDCRHLQVRPSQILFACADGGFYVDQLIWDSWHLGRARGHGVFHQNDCRPDCAHGTFHERSGRLVLHKRTWCSGLHKYVYKHARAIFDAPMLGRSGESFRLLLPTRC